MTEIWFENFRMPLSKSGKGNNDETFLYSEQDNVAVVRNFKCASAALDAELMNRHGYKIRSIYDKKICNSGKAPLVITPIRDPIDRYISAIRMLMPQHQSFGLSLLPENFTHLETCMDPHLMLQSTKVILNTTHGLEYDPDSDHVTLFHSDSPGIKWNGWLDFFDNNEFLDDLYENQKFFLVNPESNVVVDICNYLGIDYDHNNTRSNTKAQYNNGADIELKDWHLEYLQEFYAVDYKLLNAVTIENN